MEDDKLIGVLTEEDIMSFVFGGPERLSEPVTSAMRTECVALDKGTPMDDLVSLLETEPYAAVMDGDDFLGLITRADVLNYLRKQMPATQTRSQ